MFVDIEESEIECPYTSGLDMCLLGNKFCVFPGRDCDKIPFKVLDTHLEFIRSR